MRRTLALLACLTLAACPEDEPAPTPDTGTPDATFQTDNAGDTTPDAVPDAAPDAEPDAVPDAEPDAVPDAEPDAVPDATPDADATADGDATPDDGGQTGDGGAGDGSGGDAGPDADATADGETTVATGETCGDAFVVDALPFTGTGDTSTMANDYDTAICTPDLTPAVGTDAPDAVYAFTPASTGIYDADLLNKSTGAPYVLYVTSDCSGAGGAAACAGAGNVLNGSLSVTLTAGTTYYFIIDSFDAGAGAYEFSLTEQCVADCTGLTCGADPSCGLSCGTCPSGEGCDSGTCVDVSATVGDSCVNPSLVGTLPADLSGDTSAGLSNANGWQQGTCGGDPNNESGLATADEVWQFDVTTAGVYTMTLSPDGTDMSLYVFSDCNDPSASCIGGAESAFSGNDETLALNLDVGTYFIVVDGYEAGDEGAYTLSIGEPCVPDCDGKVCGADGCGSVCGPACPVGTICSTAQDVCEAFEDGTCLGPIVIDGLPYSDTNTTTTATNDLLVDSGACDVSSSWGSGSNDVAYTFTPTVTGIYTIDVDADFDEILYVATSCGDVTVGNCVGRSDPGNLVLTLDAGTTYTIVVDGYYSSFNEDGDYTLTVSDVCVPDCTNKTCGSDGCGGQCGTACPDGEVCNAAQDACETLGGDSCSDPIVVPGTPFLQSGDTTTATGTIELLDDACDTSGWGSASPERIYSFTPTVTGVYDISVDGEAFDEVLYVTDTCGDVSDATCLGASDPGNLSLTLDANTTYYIVVDGYSDFSSQTGDYTFSISDPCIPSCDGLVCGSDGCGGTCGAECDPGNSCNADQTACIPTPGDSCSSPIVIAGNPPFTYEGDTSAATNTVAKVPGGCNGSNWGGSSKDIIFEFTPTASGNYPIDSSASFDHVVYVANACGDVGTDECLDAADSGDVEVFFVAGNTYYIVVDAWGSSSADGTFTLTLDAPTCLSSCGANQVCGDDGCGNECGGGCGAGTQCSADQTTCEPLEGDTCSNPILVDTLPFTYDGATTNASNSFELLDGACSTLGWGAASGDIVFEFTPTVTAYYPIDADYDVYWDHVLYVGTSCGDVTESTCVASSDPGSVEPLLEAGTTYYIVIDGYSDTTSQSGNYTFTVGDASCTPDCSGKVCGDDGCGGVCGPGCGPGQFCETAGTCTDVPNDACETATALTLGSTVAGDTSATDIANDYSVSAGQCAQNDSFGSSAQDMVYSFTPGADGGYTFTVTPDSSWTAGIAVVRSCDELATTCQGAVEGDNDGDAVSLSLNLLESVQYFVIVDGNFSTDEGTFSVEVNSCAPDCSGKSCGSDGCGGTCGPGCNFDETCDASSQCVAAPLGNSCTNPIAVGSLPFSDTNDTTGVPNEYATLTGACDGNTGYGGGAGELVYSFTPAETAYYDIATSGSSFDLAIYIVTDCSDLANSCLDSSDPGSLDGILLDAGTEYFVVVDGYSSGEGAYTLDIDVDCVPDCGTKTCGTDGCGGQCGGGCAAGDLCDNGTCVAEAGDTCQDAIVIDPAALPYEVVGDSSTATDVYATGGETCSTSTFNYGNGAAERVHVFTPDTTAVYSITLQDDGWDETLWVTTDCTTIDETTCIDLSDPGNLELLLEAGTAYYIMADGYNSSDDAGGYVLTVAQTCVPDCTNLECGPDPVCGVACGSCGAGDFCDGGTCVAETGDICADASVIDPTALPYSVSGDTSTAADDYSTGANSCADNTVDYGNGAPERVHAFTPDVTGLYTITLEDDGWDETLWVTTDCTTIDATSCEGVSDPGTLDLTLEAGTTYFIVADGYNGPEDSGGYTLTVSEPCIPNCGAQQCGVDPECGGSCGECTGGNICDLTNQCVPPPPGDTCADPGVLPYNAGSGVFVGDTTTFANDYDASGCNSPTFDGGGSYDAIHQFTAGSAGDYTFELTSNTQFDGILYILAGPDCNGAAACLGYDDVITDGGESVTVTLTDNEVVWVVVDGWGSSSPFGSGPYELTVSGP